MKCQVLSAAALAAPLIVPQQSVTATTPGSNINDLGTPGGQFSDAFGINNINSDPASVQIVGRRRTRGEVRAPGERAMNKLVILLLTLAVGVPSPAASQVPVEKIAYYTCTYILIETYVLSCSGTVANVDGTGAVTLPADGIEPAWSPDGSRIAFYDRWFGLSMWDPENGIITGLNAGPGAWSPTWAPDGQHIAFFSTRTGSAELFAWHADGPVTQLTHQAGVIGAPTWSPDGTRIAFDCEIDPGNIDVCALELATGAVTRLTTDPASDSGPAWSPDGTRLAFSTTRFVSFSEIALMNDDGSAVSRIGSGTGGFGPSWSPGGDRIAYATPARTCDPDTLCLELDAIYLVNIDGTGQTFFGYGFAPAWAASTATFGRPRAYFYALFCEDLTCSFTAQNSGDEDGQIISFTWDFGDGGSGTGINIDHTFPAAGTYSVTLTVVDNDGHEGTMMVAVPVVVRPVGVATVSCSGLTCTFDGSGSFDPDGTVVDYHWWFGDGVQASGPVVSHTYAPAQTYYFRLRVTDNSGAMGYTDFAVAVKGPLHVGDLDGSASGPRNKWVASVTISVHDWNHEPLANVTVHGTWTSGGPGVCTTTGTGQCTLSLQKSGAAVTFTIVSLESTHGAYVAAGNHDPDGDSDGTSIVIRRQ